MDMVLANARLVLADEVIAGSVRIAGGVIGDVAAGTAVPAGAVDCAGDYVIPGLVELHTDNLERHISPRPKVDWPHKSAILAHDGELASIGVTTVFDAIRVGSILSGDVDRYPKYARTVASEIQALHAAGALRISHRLHLRAETCSETLVDELAEFTAEDRVGIVSLMDHTPGQRQFRDLDKFEAYLRGKRGMTAAEFEAHVVHLLQLRQQLGAAHEAATVAAASRLNATLASHDDTTVDQVAHSAALGIRLAEFPTSSEAAKACRAQAISIIMGGPNLVRGGSHSGNVSALDLAEEGLLDIVSSDYVPSSLLISAFLLARKWGDFARAVATVTANPAASVGLTDRGRIAPGLRADLVRVADLDGTPVVRSVWVQGRRVA